MNDENIVLEHLRAVRSELRKLRQSHADVIYRLSSVGQQVAGLRSDLAHYSGRLDQQERRMQRVERRLELIE